MCFNQKYSAAFAVLGAMATALIWFKKGVGHNLLYVPLMFYTFMEILQTVQYNYVNACDGINRALTEVSYILILVQPVMWNLIFLYKKRSPPLAPIHQGIIVCAIALCLTWMLAHVLRRLSTYGKRADGEEIASGPKTCTFKKDDEHLYWTYELFSNPGMDANWFMYLALWFIPGLLIPGETATIAIIMAGFLASWAYVKINNHTRHITPSLWCLSSGPTLVMNVVYALLA